MKYLIIMPDYTGSGIRDEFEGEISLNDLDLPIDFINEFTSWHNEYREIIPLDTEERKKRSAQIEKLDTQGIELTKKLTKFMPNGVKIKYFSEGKLRYLFVN